MRKGRQLAARLEAIAALEHWAGGVDRGKTAALELTWHQRRALGRDLAAVGVAISACKRQQRPLAPVVRCMARVMRERCRS